ncbi:uncharacterized protein LOC132543561 [Ylistrum balloti]|uniref:uncharacterized protein LOC132543561 n=1 Tax=Ylistrum balloti TaxID=509963 RepID=UPI0029059951|nr:uncharacterized protein LOC132543561 [Ylistrum balloti]
MAVSLEGSRIWYAYTQNGDDCVGGGCTLVYTSREPALVTTSDWTLVMKFATGQDLGGANSVYDLWTGTFTVNEGDELAMSIETGSKTYKSSIVDKWADYNISAVRVSFVNDGQEKAYVVFDGRDSDKKSWFSKSRILSSSWEDLNTHSITNYDSIDG